MPLPIPEMYRADVAALPPVLRALLDAELAAGNLIRSVSHSHPAPPIGACVVLTNPVSTRARKSDDAVTFRAVNGSLYSASFTDGDARFFILESPREEDGAYPDMDAIRDAHNATQEMRAMPYAAVAAEFGDTRFEKFRQSMRIDYEKWHDGIGYDLELLRQLNDDDRKSALSLLMPPSGWRDVEALATLDSEVARQALHTALIKGNAEVRAAVMNYAPTIATEEERTETILRALAHGQFFDDLSSVLDQVATFHPPPIVNALFRGLLVRPGDIATHFAAMLAFLHGKADSAFDWELRPLFLKFAADDGADRERAFVELCALLELDPADVRARIKK